MSRLTGDSYTVHVGVGVSHEVSGCIHDFDG